MIYRFFMETDCILLLIDSQWLSWGFELHRVGEKWLVNKLPSFGLRYFGLFFNLVIFTFQKFCLPVNKFTNVKKCIDFKVGLS